MAQITPWMLLCWLLVGMPLTAPMQSVLAMRASINLNRTHRSCTDGPCI